MHTTAHNPDTLPPEDPASAKPAKSAPQQWAIVELMGHQRIAGAISQQTFGGANFVRVDVPAISCVEQVWRNGEYVDQAATVPAHTRSLGAAAIYGINWCDEATATIAAHAIKHQPVRAFSLRSTLDQVPAADRARLLAMVTPGSALEAPDADLTF